MITAGGTDVEAWVKVDDDCDVVCEVDQGEAQFRFGGKRSFALELIFTERSLANLDRLVADALRRLREG